MFSRRIVHKVGILEYLFCLSVVVVDGVGVLVAVVLRMVVVSSGRVFSSPADGRRSPLARPISPHAQLRDYADVLPPPAGFLGQKELEYVLHKDEPVVALPTELVAALSSSIARSHPPPPTPPLCAPDTPYGGVDERITSDVVLVVR